MSTGVCRLLFSRSSSSWLCLLRRRPHSFTLIDGSRPWQHQSRILSVPLDHPLLPRPHSCTLTDGPRPWQHQSGILSAPFHQSLTCGIPALYRKFSINGNKLPNALTVFRDMKGILCAPKPFLVVSVLGVVPFMFPPAYMIMTQAFIPKLAWAQSIFGSCVLSFVGGVRWGYIFPESTAMKVTWLNMVYSVAPCAVGCIALMMPHTMTTLTIMVGIAGASYIDAISDSMSYPPWYKGMRLILSAVALVSLWATIMCKVTLLEKGEANANHNIIRAEDDDQDQATGTDNTISSAESVDEGQKEETENTVKLDEASVDRAKNFTVLVREGRKSEMRNVVKTDEVSMDTKQEDPLLSKDIEDRIIIIRTPGDDFFSKNR